MTDDICGAECVDGSECRHPAGSCPVLSHGDESANNPGGRPSKFSEERRDAAIDAAREGKSKAGCARAAGVHKATLQRWLEAHGEFRNAFRRARAKGESRVIQDGLYDDGVDSSMAKFLLSTSFGYVKTEKRELEHSGDGGGPLEVVIGGDRDD